MLLLKVCLSETGATFESCTCVQTFTFACLLGNAVGHFVRCFVGLVSRPCFVFDYVNTIAYNNIKYSNMFTPRCVISLSEIR